LPTTCVAGGGEILERLGVTSTPSAIARCGCSSTSTTSSLWLSLRYSRRISSRLTSACSEIGSAAGDVKSQDDAVGAAGLGFALPCAHLAVPFPFFPGEESAGSAPRLLRSSFFPALDNARHTLFSPEYSVNSARCRCRSICRALISARVLASVNCSSRRLCSNSARHRVFLALSSASLSQRSVPINTSPPSL